MLAAVSAASSATATVVGGAPKGRARRQPRDAVPTLTARKANPSSATPARSSHHPGQSSAADASRGKARPRLMGYARERDFQGGREASPWRAGDSGVTSSTLKYER